MRMHALRGLMLVAIVGLLGTGCASGPSVPFVRGAVRMDSLPEADVRAVAESVEAAVRAGEKDTKIANHGDIVADFPELQQAVRSRALRFALIDGFLSSGHAYEDERGLIAVLRTKEYKSEGTAQDRDRDALLIMSENNNRWTIYEGIVEHSKLPSKALPAVQEIFRQVRAEGLKAGQKHQGAGGEITAK